MATPARKRTVVEWFGTTSRLSTPLSLETRGERFSSEVEYSSGGSPRFPTGWIGATPAWKRGPVGVTRAQDPTKTGMDPSFRSRLPKGTREIHPGEMQLARGVWLEESVNYVAMRHTPYRWMDGLGTIQGFMLVSESYAMRTGSLSL